MKKLHARMGLSREDFENYTSMGLGPLSERDGHLVAEGCWIHNCGPARGAISIDLDTLAVDVVLMDFDFDDRLKRARWFTDDGKQTSALAGFLGN